MPLYIKYWSSQFIKKAICLGFGFVVLMTSCSDSSNSDSSNISQNQLKPFQELSFAIVEPSVSGIHFMNKISEGKRLNYFTYPNIYSGGGVAVGDLDNDGLADIYFSGNMVENQLYRNKGSLQFEDVTTKAGVSALDQVRWTRGVTMVDINNDGFLDIYVNVSDPYQRRNNLLYVNQGDMTFTEEAAKYGIDDDSHSVQSTFFDYDRDGDLDLYICAYPHFNLFNSNTFFKEKNIDPQYEESDRFYRNEGNGNFTDMTSETGLLNYGLSLNASIADFNGDGWPDIYVSNDFNAKDFLYINNQDGTFTDQLDHYFPHTSNFGMGTDAADINNDGLIDFFQCDMMSETNFGKKTNMSAMDTEAFQETITSGLHYQYMRNCLQINNGSGGFSDIAEMAGVGYTDWSWGPLFMDLNNDGWKDLFVSNGMRRNVNNNDYQNYFNRLYAQKKITQENQHQMVRNIPVNPIDNYVFVNNGGFDFKKKPGNWGLSFRGFTHGTAYADFDLDGDLDMVFNNQDTKSLIFENKAQQVFKEKNYIRIKLNGGQNNPFGIGAKVTLVAPDASQQTQELILSRGYQSSMEPVLHFGLGKMDKVKKLQIVWADGTIQSLTDIKGNRELIVQKEWSENNGEIVAASHTTLFTSATDNTKIDYRHKENPFNDYERESLLPHKMSQFGPALAVGDINNDGLDDMYIGGAKDQSGEMHIQQQNGSFVSVQSPLFDIDKIHEDTGATFFDADNDGDLDLYVVSGSNEEEIESEYYTDRFYENKQGFFHKIEKALPKIHASGSCVVTGDYDNDGDLDLFVGGRQIPGKYPSPASSQLLRNDSENGLISFTDITAKMAPVLQDIGMVTSAIWVDVDGDHRNDLVVAGEWMSIKVFVNTDSGFRDTTDESGLQDHVGWWNTLAHGDFDSDGDIDFVGGNLGLNYKYKASQEHPFKIYAKDFDDNKTLDIVLGFYEKDKLYPLRGRECSSNQMPFIKKKFKSYSSFAHASLEDVYGRENLNEAIQYEATNFATSYIENLGNGKFKIRPLNGLAQISSVNNILTNDFDNDGFLDLILTGNLYGSEVETPRNDASFGLFMKGDGKGNFKDFYPYQSGLEVHGEIRNAAIVKYDNEKEMVVFAANNAAIQCYTIN
ncbi:VCBS repeat-containing protein [Maribacter sp. 2304DJ31-5]|uniref:VCBS repeat-containing protein n=1 Tax=Maribacter sp. 2304DJ31-5 TaxID=3386273 RepID=UPI0039BCD6D2